MKIFKKFLLGLFLAIVMIGGFFSIKFITPQAKAVTIAEIQAQIQLLLNQVQQLQRQLTQSQGEIIAWCHDFNINLKIGDINQEVVALQTALQKEGFLEKITGEFNEESASAVTGFQEKYASDILTSWGLKYGTGFIGATTRAKLNKLYGCVATPTLCIQVMTLAQNPQTNECRGFPTPCDVPVGWVKVNSCLVISIPTPTLKPTPTPTPISNPTPTSTPTPTPTLCIQVMTLAQNLQTNECRKFSTPCDVPIGWVKVNSCLVISIPTPTPTPTPTPNPTPIINNQPATVTVTSPQSNSILTVNSQATISWITTGSGFDKYQIVVGNSITNTERQIYDKVSMVDYIPSYQTSFFWNVPDLLNDFAKGSSYSFDQIKNSFYLQVKLIKSDRVGGSYVASSDKSSFSVQAATTQTQQSLSITNPLGGHLWTVGDRQTIQWTTNGIASNVSGYIDLVDNSGSIHRIYNVPNSGSYVWSPVGTVNGSSIPTGIYSVKVIMNGIGDIEGPLTITPTPTLCIQVMTLAQNPQTNECRGFPTPCDVPVGWVKVNSCLSGVLNSEVLGTSINYQFTHNLQFGDSGKDVTQLQTFLKARGADIYPEGLVTGYFGTLTQSAVQRFQVKYDIAKSGDAGYGYVGSLTCIKINSLQGL